MTADMTADITADITADFAGDIAAAHVAVRALEELMPVTVEVYDGADGTGRRTVAHEDPGCTTTEGFGQYKDQLCSSCVSADPNLDGSWHRWFRIRSELSWFTEIASQIEKANTSLEAQHVPKALAERSFTKVAKSYQAVIDPAWVHPSAGGPNDPPRLTAALQAWETAAATLRDLVLNFAASGKALQLYALARALDLDSDTNHPRLVAVTGNFPSLQTLVLTSFPTIASVAGGRICVEVGYDTWCALLDEDDPVAELITHATLGRADTAAGDPKELELALAVYDPAGAPFTDVHAAVTAAHH